MGQSNNSIVVVGNFNKLWFKPKASDSELESSGGFFYS